MHVLDASCVKSLGTQEGEVKAFWQPEELCKRAPCVVLIGNEGQFLKLGQVAEGRFST